MKKAICCNKIRNKKAKAGRGFGMEKRKYELWELAQEALAAVAALVFVGLQAYYAWFYKSGAITLLFHFLPVVLLYVGLTVLQACPELLNGRGSEPLRGMVRTYAVRMVRSGKLLFMAGMLVPSAADALGVEMDGSDSFFVMAGILFTVGYYLFRIYQYNKKKKGK